jgi:hypothetical protein
LVATSLAAVISACSSRPPEVPDTGLSITSVEVAELEIDASGIDRFTNCPPPGELGQAWIPPIPAWTASGSSHRADSSPETTGPAPSALDEPPTDRAFELTHEAFRDCYARGLTLDPTQDGHVAVVLRVGRDGRVARVESYGACEIARETIACMQDAAKHIRLRPPSTGSDTVIIPAVFAQSIGPRRTDPRPGDAYAAAATITVESIRPAMHACEEHARISGSSPQAAATFALDVDEKGHVVRSHVDPWSGNQQLLACAAGAFEKLVFPPPPRGHGAILARIAFNRGMAPQ